MAKKPSDQTELLRLYIKEAFDSATEPLTVVQVYEKLVAANLRFDPAQVGAEVNIMYSMKQQLFPMKRIPSNRGDKCRFAYFNPKVVKLAYKDKPPPAPPPQAPPPETVNRVNSAFEFNPIELEQSAPAAPEANVSVPTGVKSITLTVSGVTVRIELA